MALNNAESFTQTNCETRLVSHRYSLSGFGANKQRVTAAHQHQSISLHKRIYSEQRGTLRPSTVSVLNDKKANMIGDCTFLRVSQQYYV